jgi:hypothetical protein
VDVLVLLKMIVYVENRYCKYLVDFIVVILISWKMMMTRCVCGWFISLCRLRRVVLKDPTFHVITQFLWFIIESLRGCRGGIYLGEGGGGAKVLHIF